MSITATLPDRMMTKAEPAGDAIRITWNDGQSIDFSCLWLRDGCECTECLHPKTLERTFNLLSIPQRLDARRVEISDAGALIVVWSNDGHVSKYDSRWFADRDYLTQQVTRSEPWGAGFASQVKKFKHDEVMNNDASLREWLRAVRDTGLALLQGAPCEPGEVVRIAEHIGYPRRTNFGTEFDVVSMVNPNSNAYTGLAIHGHTDLVFYKSPPGFFLLHCLAHDAQGGDSTFVDGFRVAQALHDEDAEAYEIMTRVPFEFRFKDDQHDIRYRLPMIRLENGEPAEIRFNISCMHAPVAAPSELDSVYRAYRKFAELIDDSRFQLRFRMTPGEVSGFDNGRVLHGRTAFDETGGHRHLQGIYVDRDELLSRIRTLERTA